LVLKIQRAGALKSFGTVRPWHLGAMVLWYSGVRSPAGPRHQRARVPRTAAIEDLRGRAGGTLRAEPPAES
jgi:hypothetical protein